MSLMTWAKYHGLTEKKAQEREGELPKELSEKLKDTNYCMKLYTKFKDEFIEIMINQCYFLDLEFMDEDSKEFILDQKKIQSRSISTQVHCNHSCS